MEIRASDGGTVRVDMERLPENVSHGYLWIVYLAHSAKALSH